MVVWVGGLGGLGNCDFLFFFVCWGSGEIVIFCLQSSERMFANRPCFGPFFSPSSPKGGLRVLDVHRPCTEAPADPPMFLPLLSKRRSAGVGRTSSLYRSTR